MQDCRVVAGNDMAPSCPREQAPATQVTVRLISSTGKEVEACGLGCRRQKPSQSCWPSSLNWEAAERVIGK